VLDEATLRRPVGAPAVMRGQLERLIGVSALPNVTLQVLPFSAGLHAGMDGEFTIFSFSDPADPDLVFIENSKTRDHDWEGGPEMKQSGKGRGKGKGKRPRATPGPLVPVGLVGAGLWADSPRWGMLVAAALYAIAAEPMQRFLLLVAVAAGERLANRIKNGGGRSPPPPAG
jgi:hypothetical protein